MLTRDAIEYFGSVKALAEALVITSQAISQWPDVVPLGRAYQLQAMTDGKLKVDHGENTNKAAGE